MNRRRCYDQTKINTSLIQVWLIFQHESLHCPRDHHIEPTNVPIITVLTNIPVL